MQNNKTWSTYPWWLLLVGFAFGVLVTLWAMQGRVGVVTVYRDVALPESIMAQATQMVEQATLSAEGIQAAMSSHATANAAAAQMQPGDLDPLFVQATSMVIQATAVAEQAVQR